MQRIANIKDSRDFQSSFDVSRETLSQLELYVELLRKWQKAVNLVAPSTLDQIWHRHIGDSAQIVDIVKKSDSPKKSGIWLDIGSGAGFPGLVAAIMASEDFDYQFHLVESNGRKCAFLADVVRHLDLPVKIHNERFEVARLNPAFKDVSILSARALASLEHLLEMTVPFISSQSVAYYFKGRDAQSEIETVSQNWTFGLEQFQSKTSIDGCILEITRAAKK